MIMYLMGGVRGVSTANEQEDEGVHDVTDIGKEPVHLRGMGRILRIEQVHDMEEVLHIADTCDYLGSIPNTWAIGPKAYRGSVGKSSVRKQKSGIPGRVKQHGIP
jgi:hypothetical protein